MNFRNSFRGPVRADGPIPAPQSPKGERRNSGAAISAVGGGMTANGILARATEAVPDRTSALRRK